MPIERNANGAVMVAEVSIADAPALVNALFAATGRRHRSSPIRV